MTSLTSAGLSDGADIGVIGAGTLTDTDIVFPDGSGAPVDAPSNIVRY